LAVLEAKNSAIIEKENDQKCLESPKYTCALGGALATLSNIERVIPIMHTGQGCATNQMLNYRQGGGNQGVGYIGGYVSPSSNLSEKEVVFGGEGRLEEEVKTTLELIDGDAYVIVNGCIAGMIGDDVAAVVGKFAGEKTPVGYVNSSGFAGNTWLGYDETFISLIQQFTSKQETVRKRVNLLGFVPYQDLFWRGDLAELGNSLRGIGLDVNQVIGDFSGLEGIKRLPSAELTILVSPWVGRRVGQELENAYGVPYISYPNLPVGPAETTEFLNTIAGVLNLSKQKVKKYIRDREKWAYFQHDIAGDVCAMFAAALPFAIAANSSIAVGIVRFLANEAGFTPVIVIINDDPPLDAREVILNRLQEIGGTRPKVYFEADSYAVRKLLSEEYFRMLLASSQEKYMAQEANQIHLSVTFPSYERLIVNRTYAGYGGGTALLEDFMSKYVQPY
jgi:nitrogenase molybdenum-iron protein beta chain